MSIRLRHKATGVVVTTGRDPRRLGNAWEIATGAPAAATVAANDEPADAQDQQAANEADPDASDDAEDAEGVADDGDSTTGGRGDEPAKGSRSTRKPTRRGTAAKGGKSATDKTA